MIAKLDELRSKAISDLDSIDNPGDLESWRILYLGRKSALTEILRGLADLPVEEKRATGAAANELRATLEKALATKRMRSANPR